MCVYIHVEREGGGESEREREGGGREYERSPIQRKRIRSKNNENKF
jgi:hypothetical protein